MTTHNFEWAAELIDALENAHAELNAAGNSIHRCIGRSDAEDHRLRDAADYVERAAFLVQRVHEDVEREEEK